MGSGKEYRVNGLGTLRKGSEEDSKTREQYKDM